MPNDKGLLWDEASPDLRHIVADNQLWAEKVGYATVGDPAHGALRMMSGAPETESLAFWKSKPGMATAR